jgi:alkylated DNA repair dioxygenase AlkB
VLDLFLPPAVPKIAGLSYKPNFLNETEQADLLNWIDAQPWRTDLKRRVQHYGYKYDYKARGLDAKNYLGPLPQPLQQLAQKLQAQGYFANVPDQCIVNEYETGQGIASHVDCVPCFADTIVSVSLQSGCEMVFGNVTTNQIAKLYLEPCSLLALTAEARYGWQHGIAARKSDMVDGVKLPRQRRVSLTFRCVVLS